jgi:tetratricopeptide (TPR) repeat protein
MGKKKGLSYNPQLCQSIGTYRRQMVQEASTLRRIFHRFFPKKLVPIAPVPVGTIPEEERKALALSYLSRGESALLQGSLSALSFFDAASQLDPHNPSVWLRQGLAFFEYGSEEGREKALTLASKYFKIASQLKPDSFEIWSAWGATLLQMGKCHREHHFFLEARDKFSNALSYATGQSSDALAELYWDLGLIWAEIAQHSGEAVDVRQAIEAFQTSLTHQTHPSAEFLHDCGDAYFQMGLLINDARLYLQAVEFLQRSIEIRPVYLEGWTTLASAYSQLYLNTMDERYVVKGSDCYAKASKLAPNDPAIWADWGELLTEAGRLSKDPKQLCSSVERCARAVMLSPDDPQIGAQHVISLSWLGAYTSRLDLITEAESKVVRLSELHPDDPLVWYAWGIALIAFGHYYEDPAYYEMAIDKLQYGTSLDRTDAELWQALGWAHKRHADLTDDLEMVERACRFFLRAVDLKPSCPSLLFDSASALLHLSEASRDTAPGEHALSLLETLLQTCRESLLHHPEWLFEYASALEWLGDASGDEAHFTRAIDLFSHLLLIDPDYPKVHHRIALCLVQLGHLSFEKEFYSRALHYFRLASRQEEEADSIWLDWGVCAIYLAEATLDKEAARQLFFDAEQKIARAGQLGNPHAYYNLACLYSLLGRPAEAMEFIRQALAQKALPPLDEMAEDEWLDALRDTPEFHQFLSALEAKLQSREQ